MDANLEDLFAETSSDNVSFYGFTGEELGRRQEENDDDISVGEISSEDGEDDDETAEWPDVEVAEWTDILQPVFIPPFNEEIGPTQELEETSKEIDFFPLLFEKNIYRRLAEETNRHAQQLQTEPTTPDKIQTFIGMRVYMSVVDLPELRMYWSEDKFFGNFGISEVMPRLRFEKLSQYFHANDRAGYNRQDPNRDKLYLIRPILDLVLAACLNSYHPHRDVAVDKAMIKFRGSLGFRQYMPAKPIKYGIKVWARADS
ncbi:piggyBac transposable element-derived protein 4-like [Rhopilema esculentum]|uniref:piggyBac transposable element-derived protein 4-like n=1 Tax=Rhopilema esculentum TaxID=499914 RepID=UPI0031D418BB